MSSTRTVPLQLGRYSRATGGNRRRVVLDAWNFGFHEHTDSDGDSRQRQLSVSDEQLRGMGRGAGRHQVDPALKAPWFNWL